MDCANAMKVLTVVVNAGFSAEAMEIAREQGAKGATIINARGEGVVHKSFMGITVDSEREMLLILIESAIADKVMAALQEKMGMDSPAQGVCYTMPVERMTAINNFSAEAARADK